MPDALRLLVVDDDVPVLRATARWFRARGYEVMTAASGVASTELAESSHCAIFDLDLPDGNGITYAAALLNAGKLSRVVFYSSTTDPVLIERARQLGVFVSKNDGITALSAAVSRLAPPAVSGVPDTGNEVEEKRRLA